MLTFCHSFHTRQIALFYKEELFLLHLFVYTSMDSETPTWFYGLASITVKSWWSELNKYKTNPNWRVSYKVNGITVAVQQVKPPACDPRYSRWNNSRSDTAPHQCSWDSRWSWSERPGPIMREIQSESGFLAFPRSSPSPCSHLGCDPAEGRNLSHFSWLQLFLANKYIFICDHIFICKDYTFIYTYLEYLYIYVYMIICHIYTHI